AVDYFFRPLADVLKGKMDVFVDRFAWKNLFRGRNAALDQKIRELLEVRQRLEEANQRLEALSSLDGLTGIPNRRRFDEFIDLEWRRATREAESLSLIMIDIDFFKAFNDNYGHPNGDQCLKRVAKTLDASLKRPTDMVARYGGDEFVAVLPGTDRQGALFMAEDMRKRVEDLVIPHDCSPVADRVTVSVGTATIVPPGDFSPIILMEIADRALYEVKRNGRNRIRSMELRHGDLRDPIARRIDHG
ncbi:MAG: diguanylate cyclase, partial [Thermodesulfobacteriota bacterium]|nr:diguanylate cyclase [Thermodesulfobacteriota bacterium]